MKNCDFDEKSFRFLTSSPDQRRAESTGPDGITRGSYSYLDDKGVQRTVKYIAGAGNSTFHAQSSFFLRFFPQESAIK